MLFVLPQNLFWFLRYFIFCSDFIGHAGKQLDKKAKVNFKIDAVFYWELNNCNTDIAQYFKN